MRIHEMQWKQKKFNEYVYKHTEKPTQYIRVDNPTSLQEYRQIQYNNWCKRKGVYNGSYLPENPDILKKKGWQETKGKADGTIRNFRRKSTKQEIQFNDEKYKNEQREYKHYHWINRDKTTGKEVKNEERFDRYGKICRKHSKESHLFPYDKD